MSRHVLNIDSLGRIDGWPFVREKLKINPWPEREAA